MPARGAGQPASLSGVTARARSGKRPGAHTSVQEQLHDLEVGVGHAVVEGRVAVAVRHVDDVAEDVRGNGLERRYVVAHHGRAG